MMDPARPDVIYNSGIPRKKKALLFVDTCGEDCISRLPESVIAHILSRLDTKYIVQTSILSKDWRYKWTSVYNLVIDDYRLQKSLQLVDRKLDDKEGESSFIDFMGRMISFSVSQNVKSFNLSCRRNYDLGCVATWIAAVLGRNIETFRLKYLQQGLVLPQNLLNCTSLRNLVLHCRCTLRFQPVNSSPYLINVDLGGVEFLLENSTTNTLILKFSALKTLRLSRCRWSNVNFVEIHAPNLVKFDCHFGNDVDRVNDCTIKILGATLETFYLSGAGLPINVAFTGSSVKSATLLIENSQQPLGELGLQVRRLMQELASVKDLVFKRAIEVGMDQPNRLGLQLHLYRNLKELNIYKSYKFEPLLEVLHAAPFLRLLSLVMLAEGYACDATEHVPSCVVSFLEEVEIRYEHCKKPKLQLGKFLLKNGRKLKKFAFTFSVSHNSLRRTRSIEDNIMKLLPEYPKVSISSAFLQDSH